MRNISLEKNNTENEAGKLVPDFFFCLPKKFT